MKFYFNLELVDFLKFCIKVGAEKGERLKDGDDVISYIKSKQEWSQMRGLIQKLQPSNEEVNFNLYSNAVPGVPRYSLYICDSISNTQEMAFFIVQNGKEFDWLYSTKEGRRALAEACKQVVPGGYKRFLLAF